MTLNRIIHEQLEKSRPNLAPYFQTLIMFVVKYFERDPLEGFWTLNETLAKYAVPLLEAVAAAATNLNLMPAMKPRALFIATTALLYASLAVPTRKPPTSTMSNRQNRTARRRS